MKNKNTKKTKKNMGLIINTNTDSLFAMRKSSATSGSLAQSLQRLSSGLRINSAKDDAAGLAISNRMTADIRAKIQGNRNISDGISLFQTAEGALGSVAEMMQRGRELAVQAANSTNSQSDKQALQAEINQLLSEVDRVSNQTEFNGIKLFEGGGSIDPLLEAKNDILTYLKTSWLEQSEKLVTDYFGLTADGANITIVLDNSIPGNATAYVSGSSPDANGIYTNIELHVDVDEFITNGIEWPNDSLDQLIAHEMVHAVMFRTVNVRDSETWFVEGTAEFLPGGDERLRQVIAGGTNSAAVVNHIDNIRNAWNTTSLDYAAAYAATKFLDDQVGGGGIKDILMHMQANAGDTLEEFLAANSYLSQDGVTTVDTVDKFVADYKTYGAAYIDGLDLTNNDTGAIGGGDDGGTRVTTWDGTVPDTAGLTSDPLAGFAEIWPTVGSATPAKTLAIQVGKNKEDVIEVELTAVDRDALGLKDVDLTSAASSAIAQFDLAIQALANARSKLGATQNRLESALAVNQTSAENVAASRSRIQDADFAAETVELTRAQILSQAANSVLAQANAGPQLVLTLLN